MKRQLFLKEFLSAFGALKILWTRISSELVTGTVIYDLHNPEERQDFIWHCTEEEAPSDKLIEIVRKIKEKQLLDNDQLRQSKEDIKRYFPLIESSEYNLLFAQLLKIRVAMVDEGVETDFFFIHE